MRGLDGNYMNTQGDALARLQVAYQAESGAQQARAQAAAEESLRRLREEVEVLRGSESQSGPKGVEERGGGNRPGSGREKDGGGTEKKRPGDGPPAVAEGLFGTHIDLRA